MATLPDNPCWDRDPYAVVHSDRPSAVIRQPPKDTIDWDTAPEEATHALWNFVNGNWYFWKVFYGPTTTYYYRGEAGGWVKHKQQDGSRPKLAHAIKRPNHQSNAQTRTGMNLRTAALLIQDDIRTAKVKFQGGSNLYSYLIPPHVNVNEDDYVIVPNSHGGFKAAKVDSIDDTPQLDPNSGIEYKWIIASLNDSLAIIKEAEEYTDRITQKLKEQQAMTIRDQVLRSFGVNSVAGLLGEKPNTEGE